MRVMSAGNGYEYLLRTVAVGDGDRSLSTPLTRYYTEEGTPPGLWMGSGLPYLGTGELAEREQVSEAQLQLLVGMGRDPITGEALGEAYRQYASVQERVDKRVAGLDPELGPVSRAQQVAAIEAEEAERGIRRAVAGYDLTFSVPKSLSALWGVADAGTQSLIADAHHQAVAEVIAFLEREVATTRVGAAGPEGAVAHVDVAGVLATAFDHYDSRSADPQLHTHVVVSNKVLTVQDQKWRTLAGRPVHASVVALSELYNATLADRITGTFGVEWEARERGRDRNPAWEIAPVPEELVAEFSSRTRQIEEEKTRLIDAYVEKHGREPSATAVLKLRAQATLATRPEKQAHSLADLTAEWRNRAGTLLGEDATGWARTITATGVPAALLRADDVPLDTIADLGRSVVAVVGEKRSTWRRWNLHAEASRQLMGVRFASAEDREAITAMVADAAENASLRLTPPELASSPLLFRRPDGSSRFRYSGAVLYSTEELLAAEDRLLDRSHSMTGPTVELATVERITSRPDMEGRRLGADQTEALQRICVSGRVVDVLVGPAGAGKTTAMSALKRSWEEQHGRGSVVGLAPSENAAQVLGEELGIETDNTARWWQMHLFQGRTFERGQLVVLDEASLAGTGSLDRITGLAEQAGAKVLLVGDWSQLQAVDAGGAFGMLVHDRDDAPEITDVHRFSARWEKTNSLNLRHGRTSAIDTLIEHQRVRGGDLEEMVDAAYAAWRHDTRNGRASILLAESRETVTQLNERARADLIMEGAITPGREVDLHDGTSASPGDRVITRENNRRLRSKNGRAWVRNGDRWTITAVGEDGSITVRPDGRRFGGSMVLPAAYVAEQVELGYAITGHRAQGVTVDTSHVVTTATTTRESFYVSMTRGREGNHAYVATDTADDAHVAPHPSGNPDASARSVLYGVLQHVGAELSAHETITAEQERWVSIAQLAAEYDTIAQAAQHDRWTALLTTSGLDDQQVDAVLRSDAYGALSAELRRAEANHHDLDTLLPRLVKARGFTDADDIASVIHHRVARATARPAGSGRSRRMPVLIAGLIPQATGPMPDDMHRALTERRELIEQRADAVLDTALTKSEPWATVLGAIPEAEKSAARWRAHARVVAAYRDRYSITAMDLLGPEPESDAQKIDRARAESVLRALRQRSPEPSDARGSRETLASRLGL
ncbi:MobF family relaxase [Paramicrobacterium fandaimingii]|uniref:MobF family relaxase n=1 Tax=Paramicrobacterium fandaimingii TaxID=2708079 RepID=UPI001421C181|nr:MobF family relaxase [Microbacterium fandaimingii]